MKINIVYFSVTYTTKKIVKIIAVYADSIVGAFGIIIYGSAITKIGETLKLSKRY